MFCIFIKNVLLGILNNIYKKAEKDKISVNLFLIKQLFLNITTCGLEFLADSLFENLITPYGCKISEIMLRNILYSNENFIYNESASNLDYYIIEGSKEMAKLNKTLILGIWSKLIYLIIDTYYILSLDQNIRIQIFTMILVGIIIANIMKLKIMKRVVETLQISLLFSYKREKICNETMEFMNILKTYGKEMVMIDKYNCASKYWEYSKVSYKYNIMIYDYINGILELILQTLVGFYYIKKTSKFYVSYLDFLLYKVSNISKSTKNIMDLFRNIFESIHLANNVMKYLNIAIEDIKNQKSIDIFNDKLEIKKLRYSIKGRVIFKNVDMILNKGDKVVLFGHNGSGKSSIFKVLLKFDNYEGDIIIDGINIQKIKTNDYRSLITYVPQDTRLFDDTIYSNLIFGHNCSYNDVINICKKLEIHERIMELKNGYNTMVGEIGKNINGGLRQKIFYARAFLCDTPIYLFDEPMNNLDLCGSKFLFDCINDPIYNDKTFLIICHDMELVKKFPKRYFFEDKIFKLDLA